MVDYKKLYFLRKHTLLNPIDYLRVCKLREEANDTQRLINIIENCQIGVDYSKADEYEFYARFKSWMYSVIKDWNKHSEGLDLFDFASLIIDQNIEKENKELENGIIRQRIK